jgi:hypothetical protein
MGQATTAKVRLNAVTTAQFRAAAWATGGFEPLLRATSAVSLRKSFEKRFWAQTRPRIWRMPDQTVATKTSILASGFGLAALCGCAREIAIVG